MAEPYTPSTEEVRQAVGDFFCPDGDDPIHKTEGCPGDAMFDRWLAAHDAQVQADLADRISEAGK